MPATGSLAKALEGAEDLLVESAALLAKFGGTAAIARQRIHYQELADEAIQVSEDVTRFCPFVLLIPVGHVYRQRDAGSIMTMLGAGGVVAIFADLPSAPNYKQAFLAFTDWVSAVVDEVSAKVGQDTRWPFNRIEMTEEIDRPAITERAGQDYFMCGYLLSYDAGDA
jgi:hypothetical protein